MTVVRRPVSAAAVLQCLEASAAALVALDPAGALRLALLAALLRAGVQL